MAALKEKCPGSGFRAQDRYGNPCAACPTCSKWCRLTKRGMVPYHKRFVGYTNHPQWYRDAVSG